jgi:beta-glucanase (GH16 family)
MISKYVGGRTVLGMVALGGLVLSLSGCGGGGGSSGGEAVAELPRQEVAAPLPDSGGLGGGPVADISYAVDTTELLTNTDFSAGMSGWTVSDAALVVNKLRAGNALSVGYKAVFTIAPAKIKAGKSYTLRVNAKNEKAVGYADVMVIFRTGDGAQKYRTFKTVVKAATQQDYLVEFTAPAYVDKAEVSIITNGTRVLVDHLSLKMRAAIPQTEAIASTANSFVPAGYSLAFNDEFNGSELNRNKWHTRFIYGSATSDYLNDEKQRYKDNNNHVVAGGVLNLVARYVPNGSQTGVNYESGMIRSDWTARYGFYEARVKMPGGLGVWPAFWLNSDVSETGRLTWPPEIDIFEFVNNGVEDKVNMIHSGVVATAKMQPSQLLYADAGWNNQWTYWRAPFNFNEDWHTIGAEWTDDRVTVYVDGKMIYSRSYQWQYENGDAAGPAHILLNLAVGGSWAGRHGIDPSFPQNFQIDWVRAYRKNS